MACITEGSTGFPGSNAHIPMENAYLAEVLREKGWNTFWIGKNHDVPVEDAHMGGSKRNWPVARGFDRFYGFIGGETDQWYPTLVEDNHFVEQPATPEEGYHLSKDLADKAISFIRDSKQSAPDKPWYTFFCPGANHAPHHAPKEFIDKYKGKFDDGYEAYREWALPRMIEKGVIPEGTELTELNPMPDGTFSEGDLVRPWDTLSDDEKTLFCRMAEVYAGFSEYTDHQVGRIIDYLEESGQLDNTHRHVLRRQRRLGRGLAQRVGEREQVLQRLARRDGGEPQAAGRARLARHLQPLPDRLGGGVLDAVPDVQALQLPGRHRRPDGHPLAQGHRGEGRGARPVPPRGGRRAHAARVLRRRVPRHRRRLHPDAAARACR